MRRADKLCYYIILDRYSFSILRYIWEKCETYIWKSKCVWEISDKYRSTLNLLKIQRQIICETLAYIILKKWLFAI
jgi:hypothetical protein